MKRTGFKRLSLAERVEKGIWPGGRGPRRAPMATVAIIKAPLRAGPEFRYATAALLRPPEPKREYVRSKTLMKAYRLIACQACGAYDGSVCGAHSNWAVHGKSLSEKADDNRCASLCFKCHTKLDQGKEFSIDERRAFWWKAHVSTLVLLAQRKLWPRDVPFPEIQTSPW